MSESALALWDSLHALGRMPEDSWPTDDMIRQVARLGFVRQERSSVKCLDVGCGSGAMTWYLAKSGYDVMAVDGSAAAVEHCRRRIQGEGLTAAITQSDVRHLLYESATFDFCIESQCLMCMPQSDARKAITEIYRVVKNGGFFLSRTPSVSCWGMGNGVQTGDNEWRDAEEGPFAGMGLVRFVACDEIAGLYAPFTVVSVEHTQTTINNSAHTLALWIVVCKKEEAL